MTTSAINCPVDAETVNERVVRIISVLVIIITLVSLFTISPWAMVLLAADFGMRAFGLKQYSLLRLAGSGIAGMLQIPPRQVNAAPKRFAAGLGTVMSLAAGILLFTDLHILTALISGILIACAALEVFAGYCVGCTVYTFLIQLKDFRRVLQIFS
ncbi:MAG: DUF4395 domain-containing protein [Bacteroidia bacterium]